MFFLFFLISTAVTDFIFRKVRNWLMLTSLFIGLLAPVLGSDSFDRGLYSLLLAVTLVLVLMLPFYMKGWMGAGDVKFLVVLATWVGFSTPLAASVLGGSLLAFIHALCYLALQLLNRPACLGCVSLSSNFVKPINSLIGSAERKKSIPYAGYMAVSCIFWLLFIHRG